MTILIFVIVLGIIIFVHELGHFLAAKGPGMRVDEFGFGFPPRIFGVKRGGTIYSLNWIPLGGFVKIKGENGEEAWESDSFAAKSMPRRILVILAGVSMNIILAFVLFTGGYIAGVPQAIDVPPEGAIVSAPTIQVGDVLVNSPASRGDLRSNDVIEEFNGQKVANADALRSAIKASTGEVKIKVKRGKTEVELTVIPEVLKETGSRGLGVELHRRRHGALPVVSRAHPRRRGDRLSALVDHSLFLRLACRAFCRSRPFAGCIRPHRDRGRHGTGGADRFRIFGRIRRPAFAEPRGRECHSFSGA